MRIAVLGSGNGGCAVAFDCGRHGHEVSLFGFEEFGIADKAAGIARHGGLVGTGAFSGTQPLRYVGSDMARVLDGAGLVYVTGPAQATEPLAAAARPHLTREQPVVVMPGSCLGALAFKGALGVAPSDLSWVIAETSTLPYACRITEPGVVHVFHRLRDGVYLAALGRDSGATTRVLDLVRDVFEMIQPAASVLETTLQNGNPVIHPAVTLTNAALIDRTGGDFLFYEEGVTTASGRLIAAVDAERLRIARSLGADVLSEPAIGVTQGYMMEENYTTGYSQAPGFLGIKAQDSLENRYLTEDVGFSMLLFRELAARTGVATPAMDAVVTLTSIVLDRDLVAEAPRTLSGLGLGEASREDLLAL